MDSARNWSGPVDVSGRAAGDEPVDVAADLGCLILCASSPTSRIRIKRSVRRSAVGGLVDLNGATAS